MPELKNILDRFSRKKLLVIGDVILDQYIQGKVTRISPEAPVPVVLQQDMFFTPGGAANVAQNLKGLGADVLLVGRIGKDADGKEFLKVLAKQKIAPKGIFEDKTLPTVAKTRVMAQHQQVVRIDREKPDGKGDPTTNRKILDFIEAQIPQCDGVILSDYGKGLITPELVQGVVAAAVAAKKIITVDPKVEHFSYYRNVTAITPNLKETENAIRNIKITSDLSIGLKVNFDQLQTDTQINKAGEELRKVLDLESLLMTLGEHGMRLFQKNKKIVDIKTQAPKKVYDVSGAGDTVISTFTLAMAAGASKEQAARIANFAAGVVVMKLGAVAITLKELRQAIKAGA